MSSHHDHENIQRLKAMASVARLRMSYVIDRLRMWDKDSCER